MNKTVNSYNEARIEKVLDEVHVTGKEQLLQWDFTASCNRPTTPLQASYAALPEISRFFGIVIRMSYCTMHTIRTNTIHPKGSHVAPLEPYRLLVTFKTGECRYFDLPPYLQWGVFEALRDEARFREVHAEAGGII